MSLERRTNSEVDVSVVIPVYNEEAGLQSLFDRLYPALDALKVRYEIVFIDDGSRDRSAAILKDQFAKRPDVTRVVLFTAITASTWRSLPASLTYAGRGW
jgi:undecaprenyl-phosphate 4-deoxy-4-formamido-L-arabinose transferase